MTSPQRERGRRVEVPSGEQDLFGHRLADQFAQPPAWPRRAARMPRPGSGLPKTASRSGDPDVAGVRQFGAAAERPAVHRGHGGQGQPAYPLEQTAVDPLQRLVPAAPTQFGDVGAAGEDAAVRR